MITLKNSIEKITNEVTDWIKYWFHVNGDGCNAIIGISGGKDSTVSAKLCVDAIGKDRVIGVLMPNGEQKDIDDSYAVCELLGIKYITINIGDIVSTTQKEIIHSLKHRQLYDGQTKPGLLSDKTITNLPPRLRMTVLYGIAQSLNGRVVNTSNYDEEMLGWGTRWGDTVGDFAPLRYLTVSEVVSIGHHLGLPDYLVYKEPMDGLTFHEDGSYKTDEQNLGVRYDDVDNYLLYGTSGDIETDSIILQKIVNSEFKRESIPAYMPQHVLDNKL